MSTRASLRREARDEPALEVGERAIDVWGGRITLRVKTTGRGAPLRVSASGRGLSFDPFLAALSTHYTIFAPEIPGTSAGDPNAIHAVDSLSDLVLIYEEAIRKLGLPDPPVVLGQSFGGMLAAELALASRDCSGRSCCAIRSGSGGRTCRSPTG